MKCIIIEVEDVVAKNWKISCQEVRDKVARIVTRELTYPIGYARPDERELEEHRKMVCARLPQSMENMKKTQDEAARNGLTEEILEKLLSEDDE